MVHQDKFQRMKNLRKKKIRVPINQKIRIKKVAVIAMKVEHLSKKKYPIQNPLKVVVNRQKRKKKRKKMPHEAQAEVDLTILRVEQIENGVNKEGGKRKEIENGGIENTEGQEALQGEENMPRKIYAAVSCLEIDHHQEGTTTMTPVDKFWEDQTGIDVIILIEELMFLLLVDDLLRESVDARQIQAGNYPQGDKIGQIQGALVSLHSPKYESNSSGRKIGKMSAEGAPVKGKSRLLKKNDAARRKIRAGLNKSVCTGKEKN